MKSSNLFWGSTFLSLGILLLLNTLFSFSIDFDTIWKIAPVFLILIGFSMFIKNNVTKYLLIALSAIILSLTIFATISNAFKLVKSNFQIQSDDEVVGDSTFFKHEYSDNLKISKLSFKGAVGKFISKSTSENLIEAKAVSGNINHLMKVETFDTVAYINFAIKDSVFQLGNNYKNHIDFSFNKNPIWEFDLDCGAASIDFNLEKLKVKKFEINMGAAELNLKLGNNYPETKVIINAGASNINLKIPEDVGCEITSDAVLSTRNFEGFKKVDSKKFRTDNFDSSSKKFFIELNCGVSSVSIQRYKQTNT
ncbi:MAG: hypothetical protein NZM09_10740 [Ignavibacterium sp.]|nr:hypothetical protein [Ignavibacterium sp.]MDW8376154.1 hypothetical protein [Ignavibacteriales bacterium]